MSVLEDTLSAVVRNANLTRFRACELRPARYGPEDNDGGEVCSVDLPCIAACRPKTRIRRPRASAPARAARRGGGKAHVGRGDVAIAEAKSLWSIESVPTDQHRAAVTGPRDPENLLAAPFGRPPDCSTLRRIGELESLLRVHDGIDGSRPESGAKRWANAPRRRNRANRAASEVG